MSLRYATLVAALVGVVAVLAAISYVLYDDSAQDTFERALAEKLLQLGLIVIAGAVISALIAQHGEKRKRREDAAEQRHEFLRRLRAANLQVQVARRLIDAHDSARTYSEQLRTLIATRAELEDIREDLRVASGLFVEQEAIGKNIESLVNYLLAGEEEWNRKKRCVDRAWEGGTHHVMAIFSELEMGWVIGFVGGGADYKSGYEQPVVGAKAAIRKAVYGPRESQGVAPRASTAANGANERVSTRRNGPPPGRGG